VIEGSAPVTLPLRPWKFAAVLVAVVGVAAGSLTPGMSLPAPPSPHPSNLQKRALSTRARIVYVTTMVVEQVKRKVYPYSIVPGGAENLREARQAMTDPAIKANYANVDLSKLKQVKLTENLSGYVSYRWGEKIYWTKKRLTLRAGETVFTDGKNIVRGRCLNCYSALPMLPIRPTEPSEKILDAPVEMPVIVYSFPKLPVLAPELPIPPGELTPIVPAIVPTAVATVGKGGGGIWFPLLPIIPPIHRHPSSPSTPTSPGTPGVPPGGPPGTPPGTPPVVPPVAIVPEPHYVWPLGVGFLAMLLAYRWRRRTAA